MSLKKIIVVGGNAAGPAAAAKAKRTDPNAEVVLYEASKFISTGTCELPYVLSGHINDYKKIIFFDSESFFAQKGVKVFTNHFVESIDRFNKSIIVKNLSTGRTQRDNYNSLILATGSTYSNQKWMPGNVENVFNLKTVSDLIGIQNFISKNSYQNVLIIGAGYIGLEAAESFYNLGCKVTIIEKEAFPMPSAETEIQHLLLSELKKEKIRFFGSKDYNFIVEDNKVKSVKIDGRYIDFDLVLNSVGVTPNNSLAISAGLKIGKFGGLLVDKKQRTSDTNIYAAGDNCEVKNFITGKNTYIPVATFAQKQGHVAGGNAAGANLYIQPLIKNIAVKLFKNSYTVVGLTEKEAKEAGILCNSVSSVVHNLVKVLPESRKVFGKIIFEKETKKILGASFIGGFETVGFANLISSLILQKSNAAILADISYNYTPPLSPFINVLSILGRRIKEV